MSDSRTAPRHTADERGWVHLLAAKSAVPRIRRDRVARSRLIDRLDEGTRREVVLVCTPAGFGKTTLLADWAETASLPVGWLSLDRDDNDPARFWRHVVASLDRVHPGLSERVTQPSGSARARNHDFLAVLIGELERVGEELALVLDDYHVIDSPAIHEGMTFLLDHLPPRTHVVISSRSQPPLPLARRRADGRLAELRAADLRFTPDEASVFLRDVWGLDLPAGAVAALEDRTEGWIVGLQLAALSLRERPDPAAFLDAFTGSHRYVLDYLAEEVLEIQPEHVRTFLLHTSVSERLTGPLCDAITGGSDGDAMLQEIERSNLFLIPLDEERRWFRFHHLFAELLRTRLQRTDAALVPELHRRAASWSERNGLIDSAIHHALAAGDPLWATRLVEQQLNETLKRGETAMLERRLSELPPAMVSSRPALLFARAQMEFHLGRVDSVERLLRQAEHAVENAAGEPSLQVPTDAGMVTEVPAAIALLRAHLAGARGDDEGCAAHARSAFALMKEDEHGPRFWARWLAGPGADWMRGRLAEAERGFSQLLAEGRAAPDPYPQMLSTLALGRVQQARGSLGAALRTYREGLRLATAPGRFSIFNAGEANSGIAQVLYERDELDDALRHASESIELGRRVNWLYEQDRRLAILAWVRHARGDRDAALREVEVIDPSPFVVSHWNPAPSERARLLLAQGHVEAAERWMEERLPRDEEEIPYARERDFRVLARLRLAQGDVDRGLALLDRLERRATRGGWIDTLIRVRVMQSLALQSTGRRDAALASLAETLELTAREGYVRVFAEEGVPIAALIRNLVATSRRGGGLELSGPTRRHLGRVVRALDQPVGTQPEPGVAAMLVEPLTPRELEVLEHVAAGRRNEEIARELVVTLDTVKKHVSHILMKLDVSSRTQAAVRARELRLIS